jgi:diaminohydroxyphosphoribosylaminopyrimidine deaminase/5-amino-6-(5-phosphoribosylamino)uracil reductase
METPPAAKTAPDSEWMRLALAQARLGEGRVEPNPLVGSVVVRGGRQVGVGHHGRFGGPHAEVEALKAAGESARGATLYVSLEPCCHIGKTPPCTEAILRAGISRVVAATRDPFPRVDGGGLSALRAAGLDVEVGVEAEAAFLLNAPYFKRVVTGRPFVTAKWAMTLDGKTAVRSGDSRWISSPESRALVHELRGRMDGILVGVETAIADDPRLTARPPGPRVPVRIVLDSTGRLPPTSVLARTARDVPVIVVMTEAAPVDRRDRLAGLGCEVLIVPGAAESGRVSLEPLLDVLGSRGMTNLLVEGGGRVLGSFLDAGEVDVVEVYLAPILDGGDHGFTPIRGRGKEMMDQALRLEGGEVRHIGEDLRIRANVPQGWRSQLRTILDLPA